MIKLENTPYLLIIVLLLIAVFAGMVGGAVSVIVISDNVRFSGNVGFDNVISATQGVAINGATMTYLQAGSANLIKPASGIRMDGLDTDAPAVGSALTYANLYVGSAGNVSDSFITFSHTSDFNLSVLDTNYFVGGMAIRSSENSIGTKIPLEIQSSHTFLDGKTSIYQGDVSAASPSLEITQLDIDEPFIMIQGESTTDETQSLVDAADLATPGSIVGYIQVYIKDDASAGAIVDGVYFIPFYSAPSP